MNSTRILWSDVPHEIKTELAHRLTEGAKEGSHAIVECAGGRHYFRRTQFGWNHISYQPECTEETASDLSDEQGKEAYESIKAVMDRSQARAAKAKAKASDAMNAAVADYINRPQDIKSIPYPSRHDVCIDCGATLHQTFGWHCRKCEARLSNPPATGERGAQIATEAMVAAKAMRGYKKGIASQAGLCWMCAGRLDGVTFNCPACINRDNALAKQEAKATKRTCRSCNFELPVWYMGPRCNACAVRADKQAYRDMQRVRKVQLGGGD
jgi:hypothetical protein